MRFWGYSLIREVRSLSLEFREVANVITIVSDESLPERSDPYLIEEEIAKRMVEILKEHEMTPYEYSKNSSVSKNSIYNVVNGKNGVEVSTLNKICLDLGINLYKFFSYQSKEIIYLSDDEKEIIEGMRSLEAEQAKRVQTYFKGFLAAKKQEKN